MPENVVTSTAAPGSGRSAPVEFGWRMPMWDPDGREAGSWLPSVHSNLDDLKGIYDSVWLSDHFWPGTRWMPPEPDTLECWTSTAYFAARHPSYRYGQIVLGNSYRQPSLLAKSASTLQLLSGGNLILGIGAGWMESEYYGYGYEFPSAAVRIAQLDEAVQIIRKMWTESPVDFEGKHYTLKGAYANPLPSPCPPLLIGASGEQLSLRVVAKHADWWDYSGVDETEYARKAGVLAQHCDAVGRDPTSILYTSQFQTISLADSEAEAQRIADTSTLYLNSAKPGALVGTPERITERLLAFREVGVRHFIVRFPDFPGLDMARRFAAELMPKVRG
ncbi:MAG: LLM class flavin-dependent oxidoreductase [Chloroflexota bacterium]